METAGRAVVFSGVTVAIGLLALIALLAAMPLSLASLSLEGRTLTIGSVDVDAYRRWTPQTTATAADVWDRLAGGEVIATGATLAVGAGGALPWFVDEGTTAIAGFPGFSRQVRITDCGVGAGCTGVTDGGLRLATVTVTYTPLGITSPPGGTAPAPKTVSVTMLVSQR